MFTEQDRFISFENEFRQSLRRGYNRLRIAQGQELAHNAAERMLELLGDFQVLDFQCDHSGRHARFNLPFVYLVQWQACLPEPIQQQIGARIASVLKAPANNYSSYRRTKAQDDNISPTFRIHSELGGALYDFFQNQKHSPLLDLFSDPLSRHERYVSENWLAATKNSTGRELYEPFKNNQDLPAEVQRANGVIRITTPSQEPLRDNLPPVLGQTSTQKIGMITMIVGVAITSDPDSSHGRKCGDICLDCGDLPVCCNGLRRLAAILATDFQDYYQKLSKENRSKDFRGSMPATPEWLIERERDAVHVLVDELHRETGRFLIHNGASQSEVNNGLNFLLAFRSLSPTYEDLLTYRLSINNLNSLVATDSVRNWKQDILVNLDKHKEVLKDLLRRGDGDEQEAELEEHWLKLRARMEATVEDIAQKSKDDVDELKRRLAVMIESTSYEANLTPGYSIMTLGHPEIINGWLRDPRAVKFEKYPPGLLAWELSALPERIYYSALVDGMIPIGVCGFDAKLLTDRCSAYDLQEIIDRKSELLRYTLCRLELDNFKKVFEEIWKSVDRLDKSFLRHILPQLRRLAYYHLPSQHDYQTKLVLSEDFKCLEKANWMTQCPGDLTQWKCLKEFTSETLQEIRELPHIPVDWHNRYEKDFLGDYLQAHNYHSFGILHAIIMVPIESVLLFFVPSKSRHDHQHNVASELMNQVVSTVDGIFRTQGYTKAAEDRQVHLAFACYNYEDLNEVEAIRQELAKHRVDLVIPDDKSGGSWSTAWLLELGRHDVVLVLKGKHGWGVTQNNEIEPLFQRKMEGRLPTILGVRLKSALGDLSDNIHCKELVTYDLRVKDAILDLAAAVRKRGNKVREES